jgi:hypothetical protein
MMTPSKRASFHAFTPPPPASAAALPITATAAATTQKLPRAINYLAHKLSSSRGGSSNSFMGRSLDEKNAPIEKAPASADYTSSSPSLTVKDNSSGGLSFLSAPSPSTSSSRLSPVPLSGLMRSVFSRSSHDLSASPVPLSPPPLLMMGVQQQQQQQQHQFLLDPGSSSASPPTNRGSRRLLPDIPRQLVSQTTAAAASGAGVTTTDHLSVCRITQSTGMSHCTERMASSRDSLDSGFGCSRSSTFDSPGAATAGYAMPPSSVIGSSSNSCSRRASCSNSPKQQQHHLSWTKWARSNAGGGGGSRELPDTPLPPTLQPLPPPRVILPCDESDLPENSGEEIARRQSLSGHEHHGAADTGGGGYHRLLGAGSAARGSSSGGGGFLTVAEEPSRMRRRSGGGGEPFGASSAARRRLSDNRLSNSSFDGALLSAESSIRHRTLPSPLLSCDNNSGFMLYPRFPTGCSGGDGSFSNSAAGEDKETGDGSNETPRALEVWWL